MGAGVSDQPFTVRHFRRWASGLILDTGEPWIVEPFQARFLADVFKGYLENWMVIPEGNAKTTLIGGLVLYHAQFRPNARVVVAASSRDQAEWLFQAAQGFVERSELGPKKRRAAHSSREEEPGTFRCYEGYREIRIDGSRIKVFASDDRTGDGAIFTLAVLEELHRHRDLRLYRTWRGKVEKRAGQVVAISTAGEPDGEFEEARKKMRQDATDVVVRGAFLRAAAQHSVLHEYALQDADQVDDLRAVKRANPLKAVTIDVLRRKSESPTMTPSHWRRFVCGVSSRDKAWVEPETWDSLAVQIGGVKEGDSVVCEVVTGVDGTGIALAAPVGEEDVAVRAFIGVWSFEEVERFLIELDKTYLIHEIGYDRVEFRRSAELLEEAGLPMMEAPHSPERLSIATTTLNRLVTTGRLRHDGDDALRSQALQGTTKETERGWRFVKTPRTRALIAVALAAHQATEGGKVPWVVTV